MLQPFPPRHAGIPPSLNNHPPAISSTATKPRLNHPSCRIHERFRHNHPSFAILQLRLNHNHNKTGRISPDDRRDEPRDSPATKSSGCQSAKREPRRVSTDRRSLPKAVARVVPQGAERALCGVQICRALRGGRARGMDYGMGFAKVSQRLTAKPPMVAVSRTGFPHQSPSGRLEVLFLLANEIAVGIDTID